MSMDTRIMRMGTLLLDLGDLDKGREVAVVSGGGSELQGLDGGGGSRDEEGDDEKNAKD